MAKTGDFDLIVMGSHGHSDIAGLFLGSVTHKVLNKVYCPVLIVHVVSNTEVNMDTGVNGKLVFTSPGSKDHGMLDIENVR